MALPSDSKTSALSRRRILQAVGATGVAGLAGCLGDDDGDDDAPEDLGERVPEPVTSSYYTDLGGLADTVEAFAPAVMESFEDAFDTEMEYSGMESVTQTQDIVNDARNDPIQTTTLPIAMSSYDPNDLLDMYRIDRAGAGNGENTNNYADCLYTEYQQAQLAAPSLEERQILLDEANRILSESLVNIPLFNMASRAVWNTDTVEITPDDVGDEGTWIGNPYLYYNATPVDGDSWTLQVFGSMPGGTNFPSFVNTPTAQVWSMVIHSTLVMYDKNAEELVNVLAEEWWIEDEGRTVGVEVRDDAVFHNGDPVTADDVAFTFRQIWGNIGAYPYARDPPTGWEIEVIDDRTVEFHFDDPYIGVIELDWLRWGILHKETWEEAGAPETPGEAQPDPIVGSGPFEVTDLVVGEFMALEPSEHEHPLFNPEHNVNLDVYNAATPAVEAFLSGELDIVIEMLPSHVETIEENHDSFEVTVTQTGLWGIFPQTSWGPGQFREFREAFGVAIDRALANELSMAGEADIHTYSTPFAQAHPNRPDEDLLVQFTDEPAGEPERAREILEDHGWGWDDNGDLRYPPDVDPGPVWPEGESPDPADFECLSDPQEFEAQYTVEELIEMAQE